MASKFVNYVERNQLNGDVRPVHYMVRNAHVPDQATIYYAPCGAASARRKSFTLDSKHVTCTDCMSIIAGKEEDE